MSQHACAQAPCKSCPYRRDVPSGVWEAHEYAKLVEYDGEMWMQLAARFDCHQRDGKLCAGWVATHGANNLLALRLLQIHRKLDPSVLDYKSPVPVFRSGKQAAAHGLKDLAAPKSKARAAIARLSRSLARKAKA